jgi:hypothetical protein
MRSSIKARFSAIEEKLNLAFPKQDIGYYFLELGEEIDDLKNVEIINLKLCLSMKSMMFYGFP